MKVKKAGTKVYHIKLGKKAYNLEISSEEFFIDILLIDSNFFPTSPDFYKSIYPTSSLVDLSKTHFSDKTIEQIEEEISGMIEEKKFSISVEKEKAVLNLIYQDETVNFIIPFVSNPKTCETKECPNCQGGNSTLSKEFYRLRQENYELKAEIKEIKSIIDELSIEMSRVKQDVNNTVVSNAIIRSEINDIKENLKLEDKFPDQDENLKNITISYINQKLNKEEIIPKPFRETVFKNVKSNDFLSQSTIAESIEEKVEIYEWIDSKDEKISTTLMYKATKNGDKASKFHILCDNKGPTLTLIETTDGEKLGGFAKVSWESTNEYNEDPEAFVFNLNSKVVFDTCETGNSIWCGYGYGPVFVCGCNICICDKFLSNKNSYTSLRNPNEQKKKTKEAKFFFQVKELEVFKVVFN